MTGAWSTARRKKATFAAAALAVAVVLGLGQLGADAAGDAPDLYIDVPGVTGCTTNSQPPPAAAGDVGCDIPQGAQFAVRGFLGSIDGLPDLDSDGTPGYAGVQFRLLYTDGLTRIDHLGDTEFGPMGAPYWPDCVFRTELPDSGAHLLVCLVNGLEESTFVGQILEVGFVCTDTGQQTVTLEDAQSYLHNELHQPGPEKDGDEVLTIECVAGSDGPSELDPTASDPSLLPPAQPDGEGLPTAGSGSAEGNSRSGLIIALAAGAAGALALLAGAGVLLARRRRLEYPDIAPAGSPVALGGRQVGIRAAVVVCVMAVGAGLLVACGSGGAPVAPRAAIVDQLSLTYPNPGFVEDATDQLTRAGYAVDYYPGEQVTVDLFGRLADLDYDYLVLRVHIARFDGEWRGQTYHQPVLFTSDLYSADQYIAEQWDLLLNPVYAYEGAPKYFGIAPNFIDATGGFDGATVILMGCSGMSTDALAAAFADQGADRVVGWNDLVSAEHTDAATSRLLAYLIDDLSAQQAVAKTNAELGTDPVYQSHLLAYAP